MNPKKYPLYLILILLFAAIPASAQNNPPPGQEAGPQAERFKATTDQERKRFEGNKARPAPLEVEQPKEKKPAAENVSFTLKSVEVSGATIFKTEDFRPAYEQFINKTVTFKDLQTIVDKIKHKYKEKGYLTTTAYIPEQNLSEGALKITVAEGKLGNVNVEGNKWFDSRLIRKFIHSKKMKS